MNTVVAEKSVRTNTWRRVSARPLIRKSGIEEANDDIKAGRVYTAKNGEDLIRQCLA